MSDTKRTTPAPESATPSYVNIQSQETIDGGYSGSVTVTRARGNGGTDLVFVDTELLGSLVLSEEEASALVKALIRCNPGI